MLSRFLNKLKFQSLKREFIFQRDRLGFAINGVRDSVVRELTELKNPDFAEALTQNIEAGYNFNLTGVVSRFDNAILQGNAKEAGQWANRIEQSAPLMPMGALCRAKLAFMQQDKEGALAASQEAIDKCYRHSFIRKFSQRQVLEVYHDALLYNGEEQEAKRVAARYKKVPKSFLGVGYVPKGMMLPVDCPAALKSDSVPEGPYLTDVARRYCTPPGVEGPSGF